MAVTATLVWRQNGVEVSVQGDNLDEVSTAFKKLSDEYADVPGYNEKESAPARRTGSVSADDIRRARARSGR